jgi:hypothetical protein
MQPITILEGNMAARAGKNPAVIFKVPSGRAVMYDIQFLGGYTILLTDPVAALSNNLCGFQWAVYLNYMALIGDALLEVTSFYRINMESWVTPIPTCTPTLSHVI